MTPPPRGMRPDHADARAGVSRENRRADAGPPAGSRVHVSPRSSAISIAPRRVSLLLLLSFGLLTAACTGVAQPQGWAAPESRDRTLYVSINRGKLTAFDLDRRAVLWEFPAKDARLPLVVSGGRTLAAPRSEEINFEGLYGDPVVAEDAVFLTAYSGHVVAVGLDGQARWVAGLDGRVIGGALVTRAGVYAGTTAGTLFALERDTGKVRWQRPAGNEIWATPVAARDLVIVPAMDGRLFAFGEDGTVRWQQKVADGGIAAAPTVAGEQVFVGSFDKRIYALDAATGEVRWRSAAADNWFWTQILAAGDTLYAGSLGGTVYAFSLQGTGEVRPRWTAKVGSPVRSRAALVRGVLVVGSKDGRLHGLDPGSGSAVWPVPSQPAADDPAAPRGELYADLLPADDGVYASTERSRSAGSVYFLDVAQQKVMQVALK
jgi:outer membrane protein assembly factor BamB